MNIIKVNLGGNSTMVIEERKWANLKKWIEGTKLFTTIKIYTTTKTWHGVMPVIIGIDPVLELRLQAGVAINVAEDLPLEIIEEFYRNSPFYNNNKNKTND